MGKEGLKRRASLEAKPRCALSHPRTPTRKQAWGTEVPSSNLGAPINGKASLGRGFSASKARASIDLAGLPRGFGRAAGRSGGCGNHVGLDCRERKSLGRGFALNFSKRGVSASGGVKGLRVSSRGNLFAGRKVVFFRKKLW